jgi:hypothetical protein
MVESDTPADTAQQEEKDIIDHLSEATGYFHDDDAARARDIAEASGQTALGVVRPAVEKEIERREWKCVHFEHSEDDEYPSRNAYEYYRRNKSLQLEYEAAIESLPTEEVRLKERPALESAADTLQDKAREHQAKAEQAEKWLKENGHELPEIDHPVEDDEEVQW